MRAQYKVLLQEMANHKATIGSLAPAIEQFLKVTGSFAPGLFHYYDAPGLPRTNNDLEQCFGAVRHHERRATGRRGAVPRLVVRGSARAVAALVARFYSFTPCLLRHFMFLNLARNGFSVDHLGAFTLPCFHAAFSCLDLLA